MHCHLYVIHNSSIALKKFPCLIYLMSPLLKTLTTFDLFFCFNILPFPECVNVIIQIVSFIDCLISLSNTHLESSKFLCILIVHFCLLLNSITFYGCGHFFLMSTDSTNLSYLLVYTLNTDTYTHPYLSIVGIHQNSPSFYYFSTSTNIIILCCTPRSHSLKSVFHSVIWKVQIRSHYNPCLPLSSFLLYSV